MCVATWVVSRKNPVITRPPPGRYNSTLKSLRCVVDYYALDWLLRFAEGRWVRPWCYGNCIQSGGSQSLRQKLPMQCPMNTAFGCFPLILVLFWGCFLSTIRAYHSFLVDNTGPDFYPILYHLDFMLLLSGHKTPSFYFKPAKRGDGKFWHLRCLPRCAFPWNEVSFLVRRAKSTWIRACSKRNTHQRNFPSFLATSGVK